MTDKPLISIALCTYNGDKFLTEQLNSLVKQTYSNIEIIIVDDRSSDLTINIVKKFQEEYVNIRLYVNEHNLGYIKNFEKAITLCKGDYIALSDQDDIWNHDKLEILKANIGDHILIYHDSEFIDSQGNLMNKKLSEVVNFYNGDSPLPFLFFNCVSSHALMFKRELIAYAIPFPENNIHDAWLAYVAANVGSITYIKNCLTYYRQHKESSTDILKIKKEKIKHVDKKRINWLTYCRDFKFNKDPSFLIRLLNLHANFKFNNFSFEIFFLFMKHYRNLFFIYKKSVFSKINFMIKNSISFNIPIK